MYDDDEYPGMATSTARPPPLARGEGAVDDGNPGAKDQQSGGGSVRVSGGREEDGGYTDDYGLNEDDDFFQVSPEP
jgi:hypothetical protein